MSCEPVVRTLDSGELALRVRRDVVEMAHRARSSHVSSCLSVTDILAVLYSGVLRVDPQLPDDPERDRFILSKGHAAAALYAVLAETGFIPVEDLRTHCEDGSKLWGHATHHGNPGVEVSTGSLGHGLGLGVGIALGARRKKSDSLTYVVLSDGECDEGSVWESAMFAAHHRLANLCAVIDYNGIQSLDTTESTLGLEPLGDKWRSFGWDVIETDGHDHAALRASLTITRDAAPGAPRCVVARTVKGKGIDFMEADPVLWHYRAPDVAERDAALAQLAPPGVTSAAGAP